MVVQLTLLINTVLQGKQAFGQTQSGLAGITRAAGIASIALGALSGAVSGAFLTDAISKLAEFSDEMQAVKAATGATEVEFEALREEALRIGREFGKFTPTDAAKGMRILSFAGFSVKESLEAVDPVMKLSQVGMMGLDEAANAVAGSLRSFGFQTSDTIRVVDVMTKTFTSSNTTMQELSDAIRFVGPIASAAGISFEEMNATLGVLANSNIKAGQAGSRLRNILIRLQAPAGAAQTRLSELGIEIFNLTSAGQRAETTLRRDVLQLKELEQQLDRTTDATKKLQVEMDKFALQESINNLEISKIRDKAADENRKINKQEIKQIEELEAKNRDLRISQDELGIEQDELRIQEKELKIEFEETTESVETNTGILEENRTTMKGVAEIADEFNKAMTGLTQAQETEALATIFGLRNIAAFQVIMRGM